MDGERIVYEKTNGQIKRYFYDESGIAGFEYSGQKYVFRKNLQGDVVGICNASGTLIGEYVYDAWGNLLEEPTNDVLLANPFRYRGYYYDTSIGLYYLNSRYYDPETGRFLNEDLVSYLEPETIGGINLYAYCLNDPVNNIDPSGHLVLSLILAIGMAAGVGAVIGVAGTFVGDLVSSAIAGEWTWSSWETYLGNALGGAIGGALSMVATPFWGAFAGGFSSALLGAATEKMTGKNTSSWGSILGDSILAGLVSGAMVGLDKIGLNKYLRIPGVTKGSHSWQQVFKSGFTKTLQKGYRMSAKTLAKGAGYLFVSSLSTGFLIENTMQSVMEEVI